MRTFRLLLLLPTLFRLFALDTGPGEGGGSGGSGGSGSGGSGGEGGGTGGSGGSGGSGQGGEKNGGPNFKGDFDPDRAARALEAARNDAKSEKEKRQKTETQMAEVLKVLGLGSDGKPDPEKVQAELTAERARAKAAQVDLAVYKAAGPLGADAARVLDSRSFASAVESLDPTAASFASDVEKAIKTALEAHPHLKAEGSANGEAGKGGEKKETPKRSGAQFQGGGGTDKEPEPLSGQDRLRRAYASSGQS